MPNSEHYDRLVAATDRDEAKDWNEWRASSGVTPDLSGADLSDRDLSRLTNIRLRDANLRGANLRKTHLDYAYLAGVDLSGADLTGATLPNVTLIGANLTGAICRDCNLYRANFFDADVTRANFSGATLAGASFVNTTVSEALFVGCSVYGISAWGLRGSPRTQRELIVTSSDEPAITVDRLDVAQLIHLFLSNPQIQGLIDTASEKVVLILGNFSDERKPVLDHLRNLLPDFGRVPVVFDFNVPIHRDITETVNVLGGLASQVIADITDAHEVRVELHNPVRTYPGLAITPILLTGATEFPSLGHLKQFSGFGETVLYSDIRDLENKLDRILC